MTLNKYTSKFGTCSLHFLSKPLDKKKKILYETNRHMGFPRTGLPITP